jgi:hypothetical protein
MEQDEPKRGDVRESDGMVCWGYTWKDPQGNKRYQWLTPERFAEKMAADKERPSTQPTTLRKSA